jgi:type I restriction enzyme S subunit
LKECINIIYKSLGEVCDFKNGTNITKDKLIKGEYPVIGGGQTPMGFHNEYNRNENIILCSSSGAYAGFISKYNYKIWASDCFSIIPKNNLLNNNYLYYLLKNNQDKIYELQSGTGQPHIYSKNLEDMKIPIPPIEIQNEIIKILDDMNDRMNYDIKHIELLQSIIKDIINY